MNTHAKGARREREFELILKERGFKTFKPTWSRFNKNKDMFNTFDIMGINKDKLVFVQVKSNKCPASVIRKIKKFKVPINVEKWVAIKPDRKDWIEERIY